MKSKEELDTEKRVKTIERIKATDPYKDDVKGLNKLKSRTSSRTVSKDYFRQNNL